MNIKIEITTDSFGFREKGIAPRTMALGIAGGALGCITSSTGKPPDSVSVSLYKVGPSGKRRTHVLDLSDEDLFELQIFSGQLGAMCKSAQRLHKGTEGRSRDPKTGRFIDDPVVDAEFDED